MGGDIADASYCSLLNPLSGPDGEDFDLLSSQHSVLEDFEASPLDALSPEEGDSRQGDAAVAPNPHGAFPCCGEDMGGNPPLPVAASSTLPGPTGPLEALSLPPQAAVSSPPHVVPPSHHVIYLKPDPQDGALVQKLLLNASAVASLRASLTAGSGPLRAVGLCGSHALTLTVLSRILALPEASLRPVFSQPGLYIVQVPPRGPAAPPLSDHAGPRGTLLVVAWLEEGNGQGDSAAGGGACDALSLSNVSLVRFVTELAPEVVLCLEEGAEARLVTTQADSACKKSLSKANRVRHMTLVEEEVSKDDVALSSWAEMRLPADSFAAGMLVAHGNEQPGFAWSTAEEAKTEVKAEQRLVGMGEAPGLLGELQAQFQLRLGSLLEREADLRLFLQHFAPQQWQQVEALDAEERQQVLAAGEAARLGVLARVAEMKACLEHAAALVLQDGAPTLAALPAISTARATTGDHLQDAPSAINDAGNFMEMERMFLQAYLDSMAAWGKEGSAPLGVRASEAAAHRLIFYGEQLVARTQEQADAGPLDACATGCLQFAPQPKCLGVDVPLTEARLKIGPEPHSFLLLHDYIEGCRLPLCFGDVVCLSFESGCIRARILEPEDARAHGVRIMGTPTPRLVTTADTVLLGDVAAVGKLPNLLLSHDDRWNAPGHSLKLCMQQLAASASLQALCCAPEPQPAAGTGGGRARADLMATFLRTRLEGLGRWTFGRQQFSSDPSQLTGQSRRPHASAEPPFGALAQEVAPAAQSVAPASAAGPAPPSPGAEKDTSAARALGTEPNGLACHPLQHLSEVDRGAPAQQLSEMLFSVLGGPSLVALMTEAAKEMQVQEREQLALEFGSKRRALLRSLAAEIETGCKGDTLARVVRCERSSASLRVELSVERVSKASVQWWVAPLMAARGSLSSLAKDPNKLILPSWAKNLPVDRLQQSSETLVACRVTPRGGTWAVVAEESGCWAMFSRDMRTNVRLEKGMSLIDADLATALLALYSQASERVEIQRISSKQATSSGSSCGVERTAVAVDLRAIGSERLRWLRLLPGGKGLAVVDSMGRLRVFELGQRAMLKPKDIQLEGEFSGQMCCSPDGSCLLYLCAEPQSGGQESGRDCQTGAEGKDGAKGIAAASGENAGDGGEMQGAPEGEEAGQKQSGGEKESTCSSGAQRLVLQVFRLSTMSVLKTLPLPEEDPVPAHWEMGTALFGSQAQLLLLHRNQKRLLHCCLDVSVASKKSRLRTDPRSTGSSREDSSSTAPQLSSASSPSAAAAHSEASSSFGGCYALDQLSAAFEKFATSPFLGKHRSLKIHLMLGREELGQEQRQLLAVQILRMKERLGTELGKDFSKLTLTGSGCGLADVGGILAGPEVVFPHSWLTQLLSLLPVQIARAEGNMLRPLVDGCCASDLAYTDAQSLASSLRFGAYDELLASWQGPVKVVSSMGKQSSGKSFLLNHLAGSLLAVAGGRCTDGVWLTVREAGGCLFVLLDFEGLGSAERSEQEDMLLSILNAAVSSMTIYNKKEFYMERDMEAVFSRFQAGVNVLKSDPKLFNGVFCIAIKDVANDADEIVNQFYDKMQTVCGKSFDNFFRRLFSSGVSVAAMPYFQRKEYYDVLEEVGRRLAETPHTYTSGRSFLRDLRLLIAQISIQDWAPLQGKRLAARIAALRRHLPSAVALGRLLEGGGGDGELPAAAAGAAAAASAPALSPPPALAAPAPGCSSAGRKEGTAGGDAGGVKGPWGSDAGSSSRCLRCFDTGTEVPEDSSVAVTLAQVAAKLDSLSIAEATKSAKGGEGGGGGGGRLEGGKESQPTSGSCVPVVTVDIPDEGLELVAGCGSAKGVGQLLCILQSWFERYVPRNGADDRAWHDAFDRFIQALVERRRQRVLAWLHANTAEYSSEGEVQKLLAHASEQLLKAKNDLSLCGGQCSGCFLLCVQENRHEGEHLCGGDHKCALVCEFCEAEGSTEPVKCSDKAGHAGYHVCRKGKHLCGAICALQGQARNCSVACSKDKGHSGEHRCSAQQHLCLEECSLPGCSNKCVAPSETDHKRHACHEKRCPRKCEVGGCERTCDSEDHFHAVASSLLGTSSLMGCDPKGHFCGAEHPCQAKCERWGVCAIVTEVVRNAGVFAGKRGTFEYEQLSQQSAVRHQCCVPIPPYQRTHFGGHRHTLEPNSEHFCGERCRGCQYMCTLPVGHTGRHDTTHGNMRGTTFASEKRNINVGDRKYVCGESGEAEMCHLFCKAQGRGHVHLIHCEGTKAKGGICAKNLLLTGARHQTKKYHPDVHIPKDELSHEAYWEWLGFKDPCAAEDSEQFALCGHHCPHDSHGDDREFCQEPLWHAPLQEDSQADRGKGPISRDGHRFKCRHSTPIPHHVVFVVDRSSSMGSNDCRPMLPKFKATNNNRLGAVFQAIHQFVQFRLSEESGDLMSLVVFNVEAKCVFSRRPMSEGLLDCVTHITPDGLTDFQEGFRCARDVVQSALGLKHPAAIMFLSDGEDLCEWDAKGEIESLREWPVIRSNVTLHTTIFGECAAECKTRLKKMAAWGGGQFSESVDEIQLEQNFRTFAKSLKNRTVDLLSA